MSLRGLAVALLVACGSDKPAPPPASPPPPPTVAVAVDAGAEAPVVVDAGVDASYEERLRELRQEQDDMRKRQNGPWFRMENKPDRRPRNVRPECLDNPLAKGC